MNYGDPNRPVPGVNLRDPERDTENPASGDAGRDGYTVLARRPRVPGMTDTVDPDRASAIEDMDRRFRDDMGQRAPLD